MTKEQTFEHPPRGHVALLAYDSVNDRFQVVHVDASGLLQVDVAAVADRQSNAHGYDGAAWRKLPLLWGYSDTYSERDDNNYTATGFINRDTTPVPTGYVYVVTAIVAYFITGTCSSVSQHVVMAGVSMLVARESTPVVHVPLITTGTFVLKAGQYVRCGFNIATQPCHVYVDVVGYKMSIAL